AAPPVVLVRVLHVTAAAHGCCHGNPVSTTASDHDVCVALHADEARAMSRSPLGLGARRPPPTTERRHGARRSSARSALLPLAGGHNRPGRSRDGRRPAQRQPFAGFDAGADHELFVRVMDSLRNCGTGSLLVCWSGARGPWLLASGMSIRKTLC